MGWLRPSVWSFTLAWCGDGKRELPVVIFKCACMCACVRTGGRACVPLWVCICSRASQVWLQSCIKLSGLRERVVSWQVRRSQDRVGHRMPARVQVAAGGWVLYRVSYEYLLHWLIFDTGSHSIYTHIPWDWAWRWKCSFPTQFISSSIEHPDGELQFLTSDFCCFVPILSGWSD